MDQTRSRLRSTLTVAAVIGLHAAVIWVLLARMGIIRLAPLPRSIELLWLPPAERPVEPRSEPPIPPPRGGNVPQKEAQRKLPKASAAEPRVPESIAAPEDDNKAIHPPPIDWDAELARSARDAAAAGADKHYREFDFPAAPAAPEKRAGIAWGPRRVETTKEGGLLVHLNNNCVLILFPLPFIGCAIGHKPANGDLFKDLKDRGSP
jgi:hypothetical protein